jgi:hypothetical protein
MPKYKVLFDVSKTFEVEIEADSEEDAIDEAEDYDDLQAEFEGQLISENMGYPYIARKNRVE